MYTFPMNTLLISATVGIVWLLLLFALCFIVVHVLRLARLGRLYQKNEKEAANKLPKPQQPPPAPPAPSHTEPEPVYYIVEKKKRVKSNLGEPKRIQFK